MRGLDPVDAFDTDVLIYAAAPDHPLGAGVRSLMEGEMDDELDVDGGKGLGSTLLLPELLTKPIRLSATEELAHLRRLIGRLRLLPFDQPTADYSVVLGARYGLKPIDAAHLATAVLAEADRFITNNKKDFPKSITEIDITYPEDLPASPGASTGG